MLLTAAVCGYRGGHFDVAGLAAKQYGFAPAVTLQGEHYRDNYALLWLSGRRAGGGSFRRQRDLYCRQPAAGRVELGILSSCRHPS